MSCAFHHDLEAATNDLTAARAELVSAVRRLSDDDLGRARRGGWPVRRILEHVIKSEWLYATLLAHMRGLPVPERQAVSCEGQPADEILCLLDGSRGALLRALDGVTEEQFYVLHTFGHEEYSVLSLLENAASHDREHAAQIAAVVAAA